MVTPDSDFGSAQCDHFFQSSKKLRTIQIMYVLSILLVGSATIAKMAHYSCYLLGGSGLCRLSALPALYMLKLLILYLQVGYVLAVSAVFINAVHLSPVLSYAMQSHAILNSTVLSYTALSLV